MAWIEVLEHRLDHVTPDDIMQLHYLAKLDRGGVCRVVVGAERVLDAYEVTKSTAQLIYWCLVSGDIEPVRLALVGLRARDRTARPAHPFARELMRVRGRYQRWCSPAPRRGLTASP